MTTILYHCDGTPENWLIYTFLLAIPFPAKVVRPDPARLVWMRPISANRKSTRTPDLRDMPLQLPDIPDLQYRLPELVGRLFDVTVLSRDSLRPLGAWRSMAQNALLRLGKIVRPLRVAAEKKRALPVAETVQADVNIMLGLDRRVFHQCQNRNLNFMPRGTILASVATGTHS